MRVVGLRLMAAFAASLGLLYLLAATPYHTGRVCQSAAVFLMGQPLTRPQAMIVGLLLVTVAHGIAARRRLAMYVAVGGLALSLLAAVPASPLRVAALGGLVVTVAALRDQFATLPDQRRLRLAAEVGSAVVAIILVSGGWDLAVNRESPGAVGQTVLAGLLADPASHSTGSSLLAFLSAIGTVTVLLLAFAAAAPPEAAGPAQRAAVAALAAHPDSGSLAPFATRADKVYAFSPDRRAALGYQVRFGVALATGDPLGDASRAEAAVREFMRECTERGWRPAVLGAAEDTLPLWRRYGLHGVTIGDEAVVDTASFSLDSRRMRNLRQAVRRTRNAGVTVTLGPLDPGLAAALRPVLEDWLDGGSERGFTMNLDHILLPRPDCLIAVAYTADGAPVAFARFAVCGDGQILTLDVAPRRSGAPNGVVERLVVEVIEYAQVRGAAEVSLNFAGLRKVFEVSGPLAVLAGPARHAFDRWIHLGPLYRFCVKFRPRWRSRYVVLRSWLDVVPVGLAALFAEFSGSRPHAQEDAWVPSALEPDGAGDRVSRSVAC